VLDLAPEAPWRCPENCPSYHRRLADVGWVHGSLVEPALEDEPGTGALRWLHSWSPSRRSSTRSRRACSPRFVRKMPGTNGRAIVGGAGGAERQLPVNLGGRRSMNAVMASTRSSEASMPAFQVAT